MTINRPEINPAMGRVKIHPDKMKRSCLQFTAPTSKFISATPKVAPVRHCVVETGRPRREARRTVMAAPSSML